MAKCIGCNRELIFIKNNNKNWPCYPELVKLKDVPLYNVNLQKNKLLTKDGHLYCINEGQERPDDIEGYIVHPWRCVTNNKKPCD